MKQVEVVEIDDKIEDKKKGGSLKKGNLLIRETVNLMIKIVMIIVLFAVLFTYVFGIHRVKDNSMLPSVVNGDIVIFYRLDRKYVANDVIVVKYEGETQIRRVVATEGDTINLTEDGLIVNEALVQENNIYQETLPYVEGIEFPITLDEGEIFVLGDGRRTAVDSRIYGPIKTEDVSGKLMTVVRRRNF